MRLSRLLHETAACGVTYAPFDQRTKTWLALLPEISLFALPALTLLVAWYALRRRENGRAWFARCLAGLVLGLVVLGWVRFQQMDHRTATLLFFLTMWSVPTLIPGLLLWSACHPTARPLGPWVTALFVPSFVAVTYGFMMLAFNQAWWC